MQKKTANSTISVTLHGMLSVPESARSEVERSLQFRRIVRDVAGKLWGRVDHPFHSGSEGFCLEASHEWVPHSCLLLARVGDKEREDSQLRKPAVGVRLSAKPAEPARSSLE